MRTTYRLTAVDPSPGWRSATTLTVLWIMACGLGCGPRIVDTGPAARMKTPPASNGPALVPPRTGEAASAHPDLPRVSAGQVIPLPRSDRPATYHSVVAGETLSAIAGKYGRSVDQLREENGLERDATLQPDQLIYIPD